VKPPPAPRSRRCLLRLAALGLALLPFLSIEGLLRVKHPEWILTEEDPLLGFTDNHSLFEINPATGFYQIKKTRLRAFAQNGFPSDKGDHTFRIFCLGGSTVQGRPYAVETAFTTWLRLALEAAYPKKNFEVINAGGVSYASYRLVPILKECLRHQPDLILVCTGNNEFLEDRSYAFTKKAAPWLAPVLNSLNRSMLIQAALSLGSRWSSPTRPHAMLGPRVDAMLDYERGIERYHRNAAWNTSVVKHFEDNIMRMIRACHTQDIPLMLLSPCFNLKDTPPFKSQHQAGHTPEQMKKWHDLTEQASRCMSQDPDKASALLQSALQLDKGYAATWYALGKVFLQKGDFTRARQCFTQALEQDVCPLRITAGMRQILRKLADRWDVPFYDLQDMAFQESPLGIVGSEFLVDHVHPSIRGHQLLGSELAQRIQARCLPYPPEAITRQQLQTRFQKHLKSLPDTYFLHGLQRLKNLQAWTQGRADGAPIENHPEIKHGL
jgi:tetratricopeptide (TPR) repeat protein